MQINHLCPESEEALLHFQAEIERKKSNDSGVCIVGIGGPGGSGKSMLCAWLQEHNPGSVVLSLDDFRFPRSERPPHAPFGSHPDAMNVSLIRKTLQAAKARRPMRQPHFDPISGTTLEGKELPVADLYFVDGEITAYSVLNMYLDALILVHSSLWTQFTTRLSRDRRQRGCSLAKAIRIFVRSNLMDYPRHGKQSVERARLVFHRHPRKGLRLIKNLSRLDPLK